MTSTQEDQLKQLIIKRGVIKGQLTRFGNYLNNFHVEDIQNLIKRFEKVETLWDEFSACQYEIEVLDDSDTQETERTNFETLYFELSASAQQKIDDFHKQDSEQDSQSVKSFHSNQSSQRHPITSQLVPQNTNIKLPEIELPKFDGSYTNYMQFHDSFKAMIHDHPTLPKHQKLLYLKSCLHGDASKIIDSLKVTDTNYEVAWKLIKEHFEDKRSIMNNHFKVLFELPILTKATSESLKQMLSTVQKEIRCLDSLVGRTDENMLLYLLESKLDHSSKVAWEAVVEQERNKEENLPNFEKFEKFLISRYKVLENANNQVKSHSQPGSDSKYINKGYNHKRIENKVTYSHVSYDTKCKFCTGKHYIYHCPKFLELPVGKRLPEIKKLKLCSNCLKSSNSHNVSECSGSTCKHCNLKHNSLLCLRNINKPTNSDSSTEQQSTPSTSSDPNDTMVVTHCSQNTMKTLLSTAKILIFDKNNKPITCRCLLDSGSQSNFICEELANKLHLKLIKSNIPVAGINQSSSYITHSVNAKIKSLHNGFSRNLTFLVLKNITNFLPIQSFDPSYLKIPNNLTLADPEFNESQKIDILLGAQIFFDLLCIGQIKLGINQPIMQKSHLGWIISGTTQINHPMQQSCFLSVNNNDDIQNRIEQFWKIEEMPQSSFEKYTAEEQFCENHFVQNTKRDDSGHFVVSLPLKPNYQDLGESLESAKQRFYNLERKMQKNPEFAQLYINFMREYENLNHMRLLSEDEIDTTETVYYLPHHGVLKTTSVTTKLRVVFDASAKTSSNLSLNDVCFVGPTIQDDLFSILLRFRKHNFVIKADITKMYRMIKVDTKHHNLQRIIWRENKNQKLSHFALTRVTYGCGPSAFLAIRSLHQAAIEKRKSFPLACDTILSDFYVDDLITGSDTREHTKLLKAEITDILSSFGFNLTQWMSNDLQILKPSEQNQIQHYYINNDHTIKTLGILWNHISDCFQYSVNIDFHCRKISKRVMLSIISQIFDPLGLIGPIVIKAKIMLQSLWKLQISWDETIPQSLYSEFLNFMCDLKNLNQISIPRHILKTNYVSIQLHGFSDSSEKAYGSCAYFLSTDASGNKTSYLICAKSRVAPLKVVTLPRLELCGALLLANLINKIYKSIQIEINNVFLWTDSTIVLSWLSREPSQLKTFVGNRVAEIHRLTHNFVWDHVPSADNPADLISRGIDSVNIKKNYLWWSGPEWLLKDKIHWPSFDKSNLNFDELPECKKNAVYNYYTVNSWDIFKRYCTFSALRKTVALCLRFIHNCSTKRELRQTGNITPSELNNAVNTLVKIVQDQTFAKEIYYLKEKLNIPKKSKLLSLSPFLDSENILRVGGRLAQSSLKFDHKFPILLPSDHEFTKLIIHHEHIITFHGGVQSVLCNIRRKFWPLNAKNVIKGVLRHCVKCFKVNPTSYIPVMGNLPASRITPLRPFLSCGVDFAGPFLVKEGIMKNRKFIKNYVCLFICFSTKAIHLELVGDLSSEAFLNGLKRFAARRGICKNIYSDNGLNFVGANNIFKDSRERISKIVDNKSVTNYLLENQVCWHFIPPRAPNFGGLWESAIKQMKYHMKRVLGEARLTYEGFYTVLTGIEAILNSRPISPLSNDPNDLQPLTPGHFLIGEPLTSIPEVDVKTVPCNRLNHYERLKQLTQHIWSRWSHDYLHNLQQRNKWIFESTNSKAPACGSLVLLKEDNLPPMCWKTGRVTKLFPGKDNVCRVAEVKTSGGVFKRAVNKLCVLPMD